VSVDIEAIVDRFSGKDYLDFYDRHRPSAPQALVDCTLQYAKMEQADLVVDIGSGTGLSSFIWKDRAASILGVDPSADMRRLAEMHRKPGMGHICFVHGTGEDVPVEDASADIVSCGQVFHWMDTANTLSEVNRILRPGGVFVVYDCVWPPSFDPDFERAYNTFFSGIDRIASGFNSEIVIGHMKQKHYENINATGFFSFVRTSHFHKMEAGSIERFEGILMSQGGVHALLREGLTEDEIGLKQFRNTIRSIKDIPDQMTFHFKSIFAIK
jgi:ubiquinone/menaquinone biosynthesis C-methylase UbiE